MMNQPKSIGEDVRVPSSQGQCTTSNTTSLQIETEPLDIEFAGKLLKNFYSRSASGRTLECTNENQKCNSASDFDWSEYLKCTNDDQTLNYHNLKKPTTYDLFIDAELDMMISTSAAAASIPAVQSNQRAIPRLVRRASIFDLSRVPEMPASTSPPKEALFSNFSSAVFREQPAIPSLNLLFANKPSWDHRTLTSPKSPELDPGGYLTTGTLRHCLSPDAFYMPRLLDDLIDGDTAEPNHDEHVSSSSWSSLLEGTIICGSRCPPPPSLQKTEFPSTEVFNSTSFPSLDSLKDSLSIDPLKDSLPISRHSPQYATRAIVKQPSPIPTDLLLIISFKNGRSELFLRPESTEVPFSLLDYVIVEGDRGEDLGVISGAVSHTWAHALIRRWNDSSLPSTKLILSEKDTSSEEFFAPLTVLSSITGSSNSLQNLYFSNLKDLTAKRRVYRVASSEEVRSWRSQRQEESLAVLRCAAVVRSHNLPMRIVDAEYQHDRAKLTFYYISSSGRVDFREMVRDLFRIYKARIWMCSMGSCSDDQAEDGNLGL